MQVAQEEAVGLKHGHIGTEHLLLGLLCERTDIAAHALDSFDITIERVRGEVVRIVGIGEEAPVGQMPFTARAKQVLELALQEARRLGHNYIGTEHILLGLVSLDDGPAAQILHDVGAEPAAVRDAVIRLLSGGGRAPARPDGAAPPQGAAFDEWIRVGPGAGVRRLLMIAAARALEDGRSTIEPRDVLLALARDEHTGPVLADLRVDEAALRKALERRRQTQPPPHASAEG